MAPEKLRPRIPIALAISVGFLVVQDTLNTIFHIQGGVTVLLAGALAIIVASTAASDHSALSMRAVPLSMQLFLVWATTRFVMEPSEIGLQNLLVWFIFPATVAVVYSRGEQGTFERIYPWWRGAAFVAALIYLMEVVLDGVGAGTFPYSARGVGWVCTIALVTVLPVTVVRRGSWWPTIALVAAITLSLSRASLAIAAVLLIVVAATRPWRGVRPSASRVAVRVVVMVAAVGSIAYILVSRVPAIRDRFTDGDGFSVGGIEINSSGRSVLWSLTIEQWKLSPWLGNGPGSAQTMISGLFPGWIAHPHNEYLRFLDDTGIIGLALWGLGMSSLLVRAARAVIRTSDVQDRALHVGALLSMLVLLLGSITDNVMITVYTVMIAGSVIGLSLRRDQDAKLRAVWANREASCRGDRTMGSDSGGGLSA
ncbi:O-antigen ligase [Curtobacterium sp. PhB137]|uniref:O-antigen ligase family protein n=1 Tax=Curtobacterium sp. PhB137 TaxID=2485182 RepID=UPI00160AFF94|nr:O-antigen ligase family protein [Curtobacterium sp. PhB137]